MFKAAMSAFSLCTLSTASLARDVPAVSLPEYDIVLTCHVNVNHRIYGEKFGHDQCIMGMGYAREKTLAYVQDLPAAKAQYCIDLIENVSRMSTNLPSYLDLNGCFEMETIALKNHEP